MKLIATAAGGLLVLLIAPLVVVLVAVTGSGTAGVVAGACATDTNLASILATIRAKESGGDYTAEAPGSTASGAYQFLDSTWDNYGGYAHAADAPPEIQDQKAAEMVRAVLLDHDGDVTVVPVVWYLGHVPAAGSTEWDTVPAPHAGNTKTPRQYQSEWLDEYARQQTSPTAGGCALAVPSFDGPLPDHLACGHLAWGGYPNGHIPEAAMRYRPHSGYLHPPASETFDALYAAAQQAGLDLRGWGYRPASAGGNTASRSCHGLGLAIDIETLVPGNGHKYETPDQALAGPEFTWLCNNVQRFGWITPRWAIPEGKQCGTVVGTGEGGNVGAHCCFLEPRHIEAAGTVTTHPDFTG
jgi:hypothetical protein